MIAMKRWKYKKVILIKHHPKEQILASNNPWEVDMLLSK